MNQPNPLSERRVAGIMLGAPLYIQFIVFCLIALVKEVCDRATLDEILNFIAPRKIDWNLPVAGHTLLHFNGKTAKQIFKEVGQTGLIEVASLYEELGLHLENDLAGQRPHPDFDAPADAESIAKDLDTELKEAERLQREADEAMAKAASGATTSATSSSAPPTGDQTPPSSDENKLPETIGGKSVKNELAGMTEKQLMKIDGMTPGAAKLIAAMPKPAAK